MMTFLRATFAAGVAAAAMSGCSSDPGWIRETVTAPFYRHATANSPITARAEADGRRIARIERAARRDYSRFENPDLPHWQIEKLVWALWWNSRDPAYLDLARRLAKTDPDHYDALRAMLAGQLPLEQCEAELLSIAFKPLPTDATKPARQGRWWAARLLVQKCALEADTLPRARPSGVGVHLAPDDSDRATSADQWALVAVYAGFDADLLRKIEQLAQGVSEDHDRAELETIVARLRSQ